MDSEYLNEKWRVWSPKLRTRKRKRSDTQVKSALCMAGGTWSHVRPREQMSVGMGRHNWKLEPVIQKETLGTNGVNFINEAKKEPAAEPGTMEDPFCYYYFLTFKTSWLFVFFPLRFPFSPALLIFLDLLFPVGSRQFPFPSTHHERLFILSRCLALWMSLPCLSHVEPRLCTGCWPLSRISHPNTSLSKPGPTIGRRGRNHRLDQLLRVWPAAFALLTTVCGKRALSLAPKE